MKKLFLCAVLALCSLALSAQHLAFKGIPIEGSAAAFASALQDKGFVSEGRAGDTYVLRGSFAGVEDCRVVVYASKGGKAYKVVATFPAHSDSWESLKREYDNLCETYHQKYGTPTNTKRFFKATGSAHALTEVQSGQCHFMSLWKMKEGEIEVSISDLCAVVMSYQDALSTKAKETEVIDDI